MIGVLVLQNGKTFPALAEMQSDIFLLINFPNKNIARAVNSYLISQAKRNGSLNEIDPVIFVTDELKQFQLNFIQNPLSSEDTKLTFRYFELDRRN